MVVLGDGELLDFAPCDIADGTRVFGLTSQVASAKRKQWRRVLPGCHLYDLADRRLDREFNMVSASFFGLCEIRWDAPTHFRGKVERFGGEKKPLIPVIGNKVEHNLASSPLVLRFSMSEELFSALRWSCKSLHTQEEDPLKIVFDTAAFPAFDETIVGKCRDLRRAASVQVLVDISGEHEQFLALWHEAWEAAQAANQRKRWLTNREGSSSSRTAVCAMRKGSRSMMALLCVLKGCKADDSKEGIACRSLDWTDTHALLLLGSQEVKSISTRLRRLQKSFLMMGDRVG